MDHREPFALKNDYPDNNAKKFFCDNRIYNFPISRHVYQINLDNYELPQGPLNKSRETELVEYIVEELLRKPHTVKITRDNAQDIIVETDRGVFNLTLLLRFANIGHFIASPGLIDLFKQRLLHSHMNWMQSFHEDTKLTPEDVKKIQGLLGDTPDEATLQEFVAMKQKNKNRERNKLFALDKIDDASPFSYVFMQLPSPLRAAINAYTKNSSCSHLFYTTYSSNEEPFNPDQVGVDLMIACFTAVALRELTLIYSRMIDEAQRTQPEERDDTDVELLVAHAKLPDYVYREDHRWRNNYHFTEVIVQYNNPVSTSASLRIRPQSQLVIGNLPAFLPPISAISQFSSDVKLDEEELLLPPGTQFLMRSKLDKHSLAVVNTPLLIPKLNYQLSLAMSYFFKKFMPKTSDGCLQYSEMTRKLFLLNPCIQYLSLHCKETTTKNFFNSLSDDQVQIIKLVFIFQYSSPDAQQALLFFQHYLQQLPSDIHEHYQSAATFILSHEKPLMLVVDFITCLANHCSGKKIDASAFNQMPLINPSEPQYHDLHRLLQYAIECDVRHLFLNAGYHRTNHAPVNRVPREFEDSLETIPTPEIKEQLIPLSLRGLQQHGLLARSSTQATPAEQPLPPSRRENR